MEALRFTDVDGAHTRHEVTLYSLQKCGACRDARDFLQRHCVKYRAITVDWQLPQRRIEIKRKLEEHHGARPIYPAIAVDGVLHFGFDPDRWRELLSLR